jgi:DNA-directed RNA polymerase subunit M/transcription elongation factor TFIIS
MESVDQQFRQLKENYQQMTPNELCAVAGEAYALTEIAREALQAVLAEKGITVRLRLEPSGSLWFLQDKGPEDDFVIFGWAKTAEEAGRIMKILTAAGIPSLLNLEVRAEDLKRAQAVLESAINDEFEEEDDDPEETKEFAILCPKCRSAQVVLEGREPELKEPQYTARFEWRCDACGHQWVDEGITQETAGGQSWPGEEFPARDEDS